jgi:glycosyltransferase involved in cell wall biosynthesis
MSVLTAEEIEKRISDSYELPNKVLELIPEPLVSIRTSTYNHGPYIKECIEGVLMQKTSFPVEYIIGEDYSTDETRKTVFEYAQKYPEKIRVITADYNVGSKANGRRCIRACRGKYMALCEGDDYWTDPYKLQKQVDFLEKNSEYGMCYTKAKMFSQKRKRFLKRTWGAPVSLEALLLGDEVPTLTICAHKELILKYIEEIKPETKNWIIGDHPLLLWFIQNSKIHFINEFSGVYRILVNSAIHKTSFEEAIKMVDDSFDIRLFFVNLYNHSEFKNTLTDNRKLCLASNAIKFKKYSLYSGYISKVKETTLKTKIKKIIAKSKILMIIYHCFMRICQD